MTAGDRLASGRLASGQQRLDRWWGTISTSRLALIALSLAFLLLPLTAHSPGVPASLKADEPAYFLAALSLAHDFDLRVDAGDRARLFEHFPYMPVQNFIVMSADGWRTLYFGKPYLYSLAAAPMTALWGANGMVAFNMLLLLSMVWMGASWLRRHNPSWLAELYAFGYFFASLGYVYVYWLHPEVFNMWAGAAALYFGLHRSGVLDGPIEKDHHVSSAGVTPGSRAETLALVFSAVALAAGVYNKPMMAAFGIPVVLIILADRVTPRLRWRRLAVWLGSAAAAIVLYSAISFTLTGEPTAYLVKLRAGLSVHDIDSPLVAPLPLEDLSEKAIEDASREENEEQRSAGWSWIMKAPHVKSSELAEDIPWFFFGRHTGLFLYQPFAALCLLLFLAYGRRDWRRWVILGSTLLIAVFFLVQIPFNWHGGGGFVGNRYFVMAYPGFLFLVSRIRPAWSVVVAFAAAGFFIGPMFFSPYGLVTPQPTLQAHVRNPAFAAFPLELGVANKPGYHGAVHADTWLFARKDHMQVQPEEIWLLGGHDAEVWIQSVRPIDSFTLELSSPVAGNRTTLEIADARRQLVLGPETTTVTLSPTAATRLRYDRDLSDYQEFMHVWNYRLRLRTEVGRVPSWSGETGPYFYLGARVRLREIVAAAHADASLDVN